MRKGVGWSLALGAFLLLGGCGEERRPDPAQARLQAEVEAVRQQFADQPGSPLLHFHLGQLYEQRGLADSARAAYQRAVALNQAFPEAHFQLAMNYYNNGRVPEAIAAYQQAIRFRPDFAMAHNNLGFIYKKAGNLEQAEQAYQEAIRSDSAFFEAYNNLGQIHKQRGQLDRAVALYRRAIALKPDFPEVYINLAAAYKTLEKPSAETQALRDYLRLFGNEATHSSYVRARLQRLRELGAAQP